MWWLLIPGLVLLFLLVLIVRAAMFRPAPREKAAPSPVEFDGERAVESLQRMVRIPTISAHAPAEADPAPFEAFRELLRELYPLVHAHCALHRVGNGGLLYHWKGSAAGAADAPTVFMAHYDVVPAHEEGWSKPPFSGIRENGELWGRGTLDTKGTLCAALESAETLLAGGFMPKNDVYFSFAADEEVAGDDAPGIVAWLEERNIRPALVLDEGGAVVEGVFPGVGAPCALIGTGEKGMLNVEFTVEGAGGHASAPPPHSPVGILAQAVTKVENNPFPAHLCAPAAEMFDTLGRHTTFVYRLIFANLWCFKGLLFALTKKMGGELNALVRTTCAFTRMQGSAAYNVLPPTASVAANLRLMSPDTPESAVRRLRETIGNDSIKLRHFNGNNPSTFSHTGGEGYARVRAAIEGTWPTALVSPYLMVACSDSRHFHKVSDTVLRFSAMALSGDDRKRIHGNDERIRDEQLHEAVAFYLRVMKES